MVIHGYVLCGGMFESAMCLAPAEAEQGSAALSQPHLEMTKGWRCRAVCRAVQGARQGRQGLNPQEIIFYSEPCFFFCKTERIESTRVFFLEFKITIYICV